MSLQDLFTYSYKDMFSLKVVQFNKACVVNKSQQLDAYRIYWIIEGEGSYHIDFEHYKFNQNVLFFLSPGQVFSVDSEKIREAYELSFVRDFYCIQTHDKEVSCNGVLFNNIYEFPFVNPTKKDIEKLNLILQNLIEEFKQNETAQYDMLQSYLKQFIIHSVRIKKKYSPIKNTIESEIFKDFSTLLELYFRQLHSVTDYAGKLGISPKSLTKHFQNKKFYTSILIRFILAMALMG